MSRITVNVTKNTVEVTMPVRVGTLWAVDMHMNPGKAANRLEPKPATTKLLKSSEKVNKFVVVTFGVISGNATCWKVLCLSVHRLTVVRLKCGLRSVRWVPIAIIMKST